jgi:hypothetical protein
MRSKISDNRTSSSKVISVNRTTRVFTEALKISENRTSQTVSVHPAPLFIEGILPKGQPNACRRCRISSCASILGWFQQISYAGYPLDSCGHKMQWHWMEERSPVAANNYPKTIEDLELRFSTEEACCRACLWKLRWPDGFSCPRCQGSRSWPTG